MMNFTNVDDHIPLQQFASLCRERRYKEAATFVALIENVWDVWPLMRSLFREWARDAAEAWLLHRSGVMPLILNIFGGRLT